jgi:hypothetical protein
MQPTGRSGAELRPDVTLRGAAKKRTFVRARHDRPQLIRSHWVSPSIYEHPSLCHAGHVDRQLGCEYRFRPGESNRGPSFERGYRHGWMAAGNGIDLGEAA